jgi:hypothetical protein
MDLISQAAYARHRGVTRQAINKAVGAGKIQVREENGRKGIDPAEADRALGINVQRVIAGGDDDLPEHPSRGEPEYRDAPRQAPGLTQARTATEVYRARLAELEYNERIGKLRPVEQIEIAAQRCGETVLRAIDGIVARSEELHARSVHEGVNGTRTMLRTIVRDLRIVIAREFERLAAGELGEDGADEDDA